MAEDEEEAETPTVELGEGPTVEGAPLARVASRLSWPRGKREVIVQEGDTKIRTAEGPLTLETILDDVDNPYFGSRQEFVTDVRAVIGYGPVETVE